MSQEPKKEDYGWVMPAQALGEEGGWTVEGGEEAYEAAMLSYSETRREKATMTASFHVDFDGLRQNLANSYNSVVKMIKDSVDRHGEIHINHTTALESKLRSLHNDIVMICGLMLEDQPSILDSESFHLELYDADEGDF